MFTRANSRRPQASSPAIVRQPFDRPPAARSFSFSVDNSGSSSWGNTVQGPLRPEGGQPLPPVFREKMNAALDDDFSQVRVHPGSEPARIGALAYTRGDHIHIDPQEYRPDSKTGQHLLAHELVHVRQQRLSGLPPSPEGTATVLEDPKLESQADHLSRRALAGAGQEPARVLSLVPAGSLGGVVQPARKRKGRQTAPSSQSSEESSEDEPLTKKAKWAGTQAQEDQFASLEQEVNAAIAKDDLMQLDDVIAPPQQKRKSDSLVDLRAEYKKVLEQLAYWKPGLFSIIKIYTAWKAKARLAKRTKLSTRVEDIEQLLFTPRVPRWSDLWPRLQTLKENVEDYERSGLLSDLGEIYNADINFWESIWGTSPRLSHDVEVAEDVNPQDDYDEYKPGTQAEPIPIIWYKDPGDYQPVKEHRFENTKPEDHIEYESPKRSHTLGVAEDNRPAVGWTIKKTFSSGERNNQIDFNQALKIAKFNMAGKDGDHVKDLGFGGEDEDDNYWPLASQINRRAYFGYNSEYILHYQDTNNKVVTARPIGGLIGKWFTVKGFMDSKESGAPKEAGKKKAGTNEK